MLYLITFTFHLLYILFQQASIQAKLQQYTPVCNKSTKSRNSIEAPFPKTTGWRILAFSNP